ncbi:4-aminobutyrate aminotransferase-like enzyme [Bradyrhizobium sp. GM6.1]
MKSLARPRKMQAFEVLESNGRSYSRSFAARFGRARDSVLLTEDGRKVVDFLSRAGTLNVGHNNYQIVRGRGNGGGL